MLGGDGAGWGMRGVVLSLTRDAQQGPLVGGVLGLSSAGGRGLCTEDVGDQGGGEPAHRRDVGSGVGMQGPLLFL